MTVYADISDPDPLAELMSPDLWADISYADAFALRGKSAAEKRVIRDRWLWSFLHKRLELPRVTRTGALFFRSLVRDDYKALFHAVIDASGIRDCLVVEDYIAPMPKGQLNRAASAFMLNHFDLFDALDVDDPLDRACCFIRACRYAQILDHLRRIWFQALICFADMQPVEHLLTRYFRARGVTTITLQHGLYVDYGDMDTVNVINYLHQPSEYFLSWGPETSQLIARHHPGAKPVDCGKPLIFSADPPDGAPPPQPYIAVFLDQQIFNAENEAMLEIVIRHARRSARAVKVRFHPSIDKAAFFEKFPEIREQLHFSDADFVVGHTSSLIYEALTMGCRVLRYESAVPGIALPETCSFRTLEQLETCLVLKPPKDLATRYFHATGDAARRNYARVFRELLPALTAP